MTIDGEYDEAGHRAAFRDIYVKRGDAAFDFVTEHRDGEEWSKDADLSCRKVQ